MQQCTQPTSLREFVCCGGSRTSCSAYYTGPRTCVTPAMDTITRAAGVPNILSMCMAPQSSDGSSSTTGTFTVGQPDPALYTGELVSTPIVTPNGQLSAYFVPLGSVGVNGSASVVSDDLPQYALVDSGTTMWILPSITITALSNLVYPISPKLAGELSSEYAQGQCHTWSPAEYAALPALTLTLGSAVLTVPPSVYMMRCGVNMYRVGVVNGGTFPPPPVVCMREPDDEQ